MFSRFLSGKKPPPKRQEPKIGEGRRENPARPIVMLMLKQPLSLDGERLSSVLRSRYKKPDGTEPLVTVTGGNLVSFAGVIVAIMTIDQPIPGDFQGLGAPGRTPHWPQTAEVCASHRGHVILSLMGQPPDFLNGVRALTAVAGAVAALYPDLVVGGFFKGRVVNSGEVWAQQSAASFAPYPNLPVSLWVSQLPFKDEKTGGLGVVTTGLTLFVGRELELTASGRDLRTLLDRAFGLTTYLVQNGPVLKDGSTFGVSDTERIAVCLRISSRFEGLPVIEAALA